MNRIGTDPCCCCCPVVPVVEVDDAYAACDTAAAKGGKVLRPAGPMSHGTTVFAFIEDPDGYPIEFIQKGTAGWAQALSQMGRV